MLGGVVFSTLRTFFHRQRRHRALQPAAIGRVIWIGSKLNWADYSPYPHTQCGFFRAFNILSRLSADKEKRLSKTIRRVRKRR